MKKYLTFFFFLVSFTISAQENDSSKWVLSTSFGPSYHLFYELSDFITDQYNDQFNVTVDDNQKMLSFYLNLSYKVTNEFSIGSFYQFDIGTIGFKYSIKNIEDINYSYSSNSFGISSGYQFYKFGSVESSVNIFGGLIIHNLENSDLSIAVQNIQNSSSFGFHGGIVSENTLDLTDQTNLVVMFGGEMKTSGTVKSNSSEYDFQSINYFIRFGIDFEL